MSKKYIVSIGYDELLVPDLQTAATILESIPVKNKKGEDGVYRYSKDLELRMSMKVVDESLVNAEVETSDAK